MPINEPMNFRLTHPPMLWCVLNTIFGDFLILLFMWDALHILMMQIKKATPKGGFNLQHFFAISVHDRIGIRSLC